MTADLLPSEIHLIACVRVARDARLDWLDAVNAVKMLATPQNTTREARAFSRWREASQAVTNAAKRSVEVE